MRLNAVIAGVGMTRFAKHPRSVAEGAKSPVGENQDLHGALWHPRKSCSEEKRHPCRCLFLR